MFPGMPCMRMVHGETKSDGTLVSSQERRAGFVPQVNRTAGFVPLFGINGFRLAVLPGSRRKKHVFFCDSAGNGNGQFLGESTRQPRHARDMSGFWGRQVLVDDSVRAFAILSKVVVFGNLGRKAKSYGLATHS